MQVTPDSSISDDEQKLLKNISRYKDMKKIAKQLQKREEGIKDAEDLLHRVFLGRV